MRDAAYPLDTFDAIGRCEEPRGSARGPICTADSVKAQPGWLDGVRLRRAVVGARSPARQRLRILARLAASMTTLRYDSRFVLPPCDHARLRMASASVASLSPQQGLRGARGYA